MLCKVSLESGNGEFNTDMQQDKPVLTAFIICTVYSVLSTGCILHNKYVLAYVMPHESILMLSQNIFTITFIVLVGKRVAENSASASESAGESTMWRLLVPKYTLYHSKGDWLVGVSFALSVITGIYCLSYLTVPTFAAVKKSGMLFSWLMELQNPSGTTWACFPSLLVVTLGSICQTWYDLEFSTAGVVHGLLSCFFQSASFEIGKRMVTHGKDLWSVLFINSIVSFIVQLMYMTLYGEAHLIETTISTLVFGNESSLQAMTNKEADEHLHPARASKEAVGLHLLLNCTLVLLMNFSVFLNCTVNSPLAHVVTGNVKANFTTICAIVLFSLHLHIIGYVGIAIGACGGIWFSWIKYDAECKRKAAAASGGTTNDKDKIQEV